MPIEDLSDDEQIALEKGGLDALSNDAQKRLEEGQSHLDRALSAAQEIGRGLVEGAAHTLPGRGYRGLATGAKSLAVGEGLGKASERATETIREEYAPRTTPEKIGAAGGMILANAPAFLGLSATAPTFLPAAGAGLARLGLARAAHGAATFGAFEGLQEAGEQAIKPEPFDPERIAKRAAGGVGIGAGIGAAGMVTPVLAARGVAKGLMARLAGAAAEAGVGGAGAVAQGGEPEDVATNAALFGFLGFLGNRNYDARFRQAVKNDIIDQAVKPMVDSGMPAAQARVKAAQEFDTLLVRAGFTVERMKSTPEYSAAVRQISERLLAQQPELGPRAEARARQALDNAIAEGEVPISELSKVKVEPPKPAEPTPAPPQELPQPEPGPAIPEPTREIMARTGITDPEIARSLAEPPISREVAPGGPVVVPEAPLAAKPSIADPGAAQMPQEAIGEAHAEEGDTSFFEPLAETAERPLTPEEVAEAQALAQQPISALEPTELQRRFPGVTQPQIEAILTQAAERNQPLSEAAVKAFPGLEGSMRETQERLSRQRAGPKKPIHNAIRELGYLDLGHLERFRDLAGYGELKDMDILGQVAKKSGRIKGLDALAEALKERGLLQERDIGELLERLGSEARGGVASMVGEPGAKYQAVRIRKPAQQLMPEETQATMERHGIKPGAELPMIRQVPDPIFGTIKKGQVVKVLASDLEGGNVLIEHGEADLAGKRQIAVVPVRALAEPVRIAPAEQPSGREVREQVAEATGVKPAEKRINISEAKALREVLKAQVRGARMASLKERHQARIEIRRVIMENMLKRQHEQFWGQMGQQIRGKIAAYAKSVLPLDQQGKFITKVASARTLGDLARAYYAIEQEAQRILSKQYDHDIVAILDHALESASFPVEFKKLIREAIAQEGRLENWSDKTLEILKTQKEFIDHVRATGEDIIVPEAILEQVAKLVKQPISQMPVPEKERILINLHHIVARGYDVADIKEEMRLAQRESELTELRAQTTGIISPSYAAGQKLDPIAALTWAEKNARDFQRTLDFFQNAGISLMPQQELFARLDGGNIDGPMRRYFNDRYQTGYAPTLREFGELQDHSRATMKEADLTETEWRELGTFFMAEQERGGDKLAQLGITEQRIAEVKAKLNDKQRKWFWLRDWFNDEVRFERMAKVLAETENIEIKKVLKYWPMVTRQDTFYDKYSVADRIGMEFEGLRVRPEAGFSKERLPHARQDIELHALKIFNKRALDHLWLSNLGEAMRDMRELLKDPELQTGLGDVGYLAVKEWLDVIHGAGGASGASRVQVIDRLLKNTGVAVMAIRPHAGLIQLSAFFDAASRIGMGHTMRGLEMLSEPQWVEFIKTHAPQVYYRGGNYPEINNVLAGGNLSWWNRFGMAHIVWGDSMPARSAFLGAYLQYAEKHGIEIAPAAPNADALRHALYITTKTQGSPHLGDMALAISRGKLLGGRGHLSLSRMLLQYGNFMLFRFSNLKTALYDFPKGGEQSRDAAMAAFWLMMGSMAVSGIRYGANDVYAAIANALGWIDDKQLETIQKRNNFERIAMNEVLSTPPFMGNIMSVMTHRGTGIPLIDMVRDSLVGPYVAISGAIADKPVKASRGLIQSLTSAASLLGVGGAQFIGRQFGRQLYGKKDIQSGRSGSRRRRSR